MCFFKRITQKRNRDFKFMIGSPNRRSSIRLRFSLFQPIDFPWDNSTVYKPSASDVERILSARKQRFEPAPCNQYQANSGQRKNLLRRPRRRPDPAVAVKGAHPLIAALRRVPSMVAASSVRFVAPLGMTNL